MTPARFDLLELLSDVACDEASRLSLSPFPSRSTSTNLTSESPIPPYSSAYIRDAPLRAAPISVVQVLSSQTAPRFGGVRKPTRQGNAATVAVVSGWKGRSTPSRFCHICSRTAKKVELLSCANLASGACRKVVCEKCFIEYKWDWKAAIRSRASWQCTHCRRVCPNRAQCAIYRRTNERRREQQQTTRARHLHNRSLESSIPVPYNVLSPTRIAPGNNHY